MQCELADFQRIQYRFYISDCTSSNDNSNSFPVEDYFWRQVENGIQLLKLPLSFSGSPGSRRSTYGLATNRMSLFVFCLF